MIGFGQTDRTGNDFFELYKGDYCYWKINEMKESRNVLDILINSQNQFLIEGTLRELKDIKSIVHRFLTNKGRDASWPDNIDEAIIAIRSTGYKTLDYEIIRIIYNTYDELNIPIDDRKLCYGTILLGKPKLPTPPPPPEVIEIVEDDDEVFWVVENMPKFPCMKFKGDKKEYCGELALMKYIQKNVKYPPIAKEYNITGKVYVSFIVDKSGSLTNVKIVRGVDKNLDAEALRVVKTLPKYKSGKQRGKSVRVMFTIPINFTLN